MTTDNKGAMTGEHCINCGLKVDPKCACSRGRALLVAQPAQAVGKQPVAYLVTDPADDHISHIVRPQELANKLKADGYTIEALVIDPVPAEGATTCCRKNPCLYPGKGPCDLPAAPEPIHASDATSGLAPEFIAWFDQVWAAYPDKPFVDKISAMTWAFKAYKQFRPTSAVDAVRTATPMVIDLEDLKTKLLTPRQILRDEDGMFHHPDMPILGESVNMREFLAMFGLETAYDSIEDAAPDISKRYFEAGEPDCSYWTPTPPRGDGWMLIYIFNTEDGPCAWYVRDAAKGEV